ncbi:MAG: hypothetical protein A2Z27_02825 [candidate division Zixibacteria bacterium RBG_16_50_21]|nr:MAG: hypothetical protein A2Z27_02825 [candidate division Zixibacteria bacterium RBG_16_50_21]
MVGGGGGSALVRGKNDEDTWVSVNVGETSDGRNAIYVANLVYNPDTLAFELMRQPVVNVGGDLTVSMGDVEALLSGNYFKQEMYDYSGSDLIYLGRHLSVTAAEADTAWWIWKYTYGSGLVTRKQGPLVGAWTGRVGLGW